MPVDTLDTVPDKIDEDCDGRIDENVDYTKANCPRGSKIIEGTRGNDILKGTIGADCILGYGGNDTIYGDRGDDTIFGGPGDDKIYPGPGGALVRAGAGNDTVDTSDCSAATVYGEAGRDVLTGGSGPDTFYGGDDNDVLNGGGGKDSLDGGGCHDLLIGGAAVDKGVGGNDVDVCDTESSSQCEKTLAQRVACQNDGNCAATERCAKNSAFCVPRTAANCGSCTATSSTDTTCNGVDDDCDGLIDDDYVPHSVSCGVGACSAMAQTRCVAGVEDTTCHAGTPLPGNDATCNGIDDDCDGRTDEGYVTQPTTCGTGACANTGMWRCMNGAPVNDCLAHVQPSSTDTTCDGIDDDCDGNIDDDYQPPSTHCGNGVCTASGLLLCIAGATKDTCQTTPPIASTDTTCDGIDDDCDGTADDDYVSTDNTCGMGVCASTGKWTCTMGAVVSTCQAGPALASTDTTCDGIDDDCDGTADDDYVTMPTTCTSGPCTGTGQTSCQNGSIVDSCMPTTCPVAETACDDGQDNDQDGKIDCADSDCSQATGCILSSFGASCASNADCDTGLSCSHGFPGGYCTRACGTGCPQGAFCMDLGGGNAACVLDCGPGGQCDHPGYVCASGPTPPFTSQPFCRPTCDTGSCAGTCNATYNLCM